MGRAVPYRKNSMPARRSLPARSKKFGVGKQIGGAVYVHRSAEAALPQDDLARAKAAAPGFAYAVVKYVLSDRTVSLIESADWDEADEPTAGRSVVVKADGRVAVVRPPSDPWIYHHKWLFVRDDYGGFDVAAAKARSAAWGALGGVDRSRIGKRSYWEAEVVPRLAR
jgi:hypothetical protein